MKKMQKALLTLLVAWGSCHAAPAQQPIDDATDQKMILHYVNQYRSQHHLGKLTLNPLISAEAARHSREMATRAVGFGHSGFNRRIKKLYSQIPGCDGGAENVAFYRINPKKLVNGWLASPGHRHNIQGHYNLTGIGIAHGKKGWAYYTQIFLRCDQHRKSTHVHSPRKRIRISLPFIQIG